MAGKLRKIEGNGPPQGSREEGFSGLKKEGGAQRRFCHPSGLGKLGSDWGGMRIGVGAGSSEGGREEDVEAARVEGEEKGTVRPEESGGWTPQGSLRSSVEPEPSR